MDFSRRLMMKEVIEQYGVLFEPELFGNIVVGFTKEVTTLIIAKLILKDCDIPCDNKYLNSNMVIVEGNQHNPEFYWDYGNFQLMSVEELEKLYFETRKGS